MGTRGFRAWRFRKRYYLEYRTLDTFPEGLGSQIVREIPSDSNKYSAWLAALRRTAETWEAAWDDYLTIELKHNEQCDEGPPRPSMSWLVPVNDMFIEWIWILDLDREVLTVNNGAHSSLHCYRRSIG